MGPLVSMQKKIEPAEQVSTLVEQTGLLNTVHRLLFLLNSFSEIRHYYCQKFV